MNEKDTPEKNQSIADEIWRKTRTTFQEHLAEVYKDRRKRMQGEETDGILIKNGTPHEPSLLLEPNGNLKWVQSSWNPEPFEDLEISDMGFCILATEIIENSPEPKTPIKSA